jgi:signal peptidase
MKTDAQAGPVSLVRQSLAWLLILAIGAMIAVAVVVPRVGGAVPYVIETGSMQPGLPPGTLVVVRPVAPERIAIGDVVTYQLVSGQPEVVTHRVVAQGIDMTGKPRFRTQGDANNAADPGWVQPVQVRGERWYAVPLLGYVTTLLTGAQRALLVLVLAGVLLAYAAFMFATDLRDRVRIRRGVSS